jgi:hypothetical protein
LISAAAQARAFSYHFLRLANQIIIRMGTMVFTDD